MQLKLGRCEISMSPPLDSPRALSSSVACGFRDLVRNMFLIQPPCKALSIYMPDIDHDWCLNLITKVQDADGIRVGHLLSQLDNHFGQVIERWHTQASTLRKAIAEPDWIELSNMGSMPCLWDIPGWPKLVIMLDAFEKSTQTLAHRTYYPSYQYYQLCEDEW